METLYFPENHICMGEAAAISSHRLFSVALALLYFISATE
jgi:hypothetical protein